MIRLVMLDAMGLDSRRFCVGVATGWPGASRLGVALAQPGSPGFHPGHPGKVESAGSIPQEMRTCGVFFENLFAARFTRVIFLILNKGRFAEPSNSQAKPRRQNRPADATCMLRPIKTPRFAQSASIVSTNMTGNRVERRGTGAETVAGRRRLDFSEDTLVYSRRCLFFL